MPPVLRLPARRRDAGASPISRLRLWLAALHGECRHAERFLLDRRHLLELDGRLLADVGLTREDVLRDMPFRRGRQDGPG